MFQPYEAPKKKGSEEAKDSLQSLIEMRKFTRPTVVVQAFLRSCFARQIVSELCVSKAESKISDIKKLKAILGDKLKVLPLKNLKDVIISCNLAKRSELLWEIRDFLDSSINSRDQEFNIFGAKSNWNFIV